MIFPNVRRSLGGLALIVAVALIGCRSEGPRIQQGYPETKYLSREGEVGGQKFRYRVSVPPSLKHEPLGFRNPVLFVWLGKQKKEL